MGHLCHDKGEIAVLGRLVEVMAFNNHNYKIYPSWQYGIIYVWIDAYGVNSNDNDIAANIIEKNKKSLLTLETEKISNSLHC